MDTIFLMKLCYKMANEPYSFYAHLICFLNYFKYSCPCFRSIVLWTTAPQIQKAEYSSEIDARLLLPYILMQRLSKYLSCREGKQLIL